MKNRKSSCKKDETYGVIALRIILYLGLFILFIIIPIFCCKYHPKARYLRRKWSKVSEDPNSSTKNKINEQNIEGLVGDYGSSYSGGDFEESGVSGVSGGDRVKNPGLIGDYGSGVYGGNYRSGNDIYREGGNNEIDGNSGNNGITGIRY